VPDSGFEDLRKILNALLLVQLHKLDEAERFPLLVRSGWNNAEIALALGMTENAIAVRRTRLKGKTIKEKNND
jgi:DNA-binding CsgD family transcriptional regulator